MRKPFVAGNWKMNKTIAETRDLVSQLSEKISAITGVEKIICPPFVSLQTASALIGDSDIGLGAQNMHWEEKGAFTGEVSPAMVKELCGYVILGHSERRAYFNESDEIVNRKLISAQKYDLTPIVCVGETLDQYESKLTREVVSRQTSQSLRDVSPDFAPRIVVAYEPVWAIGTGKASNGLEANAVVKDVIRPALTELFGLETAQAIRVLYGGSVTSSNAAEFFGQPDIDGALVGGASLKLDEFAAITRAAAG
ncbi:triose-phosphate isomerase [Candidatus Villigracilis saccharophilus]|uniref:triose-phosphate isomerase n=1 Tax=Candidatus Villigracilis saccharophilus TaxID=3140684 RepID=UPI0031376BD6|nr:triose-phosphate isomerase [Anaerolineales bacterium]